AGPPRLFDEVVWNTKVQSKWVRLASLKSTNKHTTPRKAKSSQVSAVVDSGRETLRPSGDGYPSRRASMISRSGSTCRASEADGAAASVTRRRHAEISRRFMVSIITSFQSAGQG